MSQPQEDEIAALKRRVNRLEGDLAQTMNAVRILTHENESMRNRVKELTEIARTGIVGFGSTFLDKDKT